MRVCEVSFSPANGEKMGLNNPWRAGLSRTCRVTVRAISLLACVCFQAFTRLIIGSPC